LDVHTFFGGPPWLFHRDTGAAGPRYATFHPGDGDSLVTFVAAVPETAAKKAPRPTTRSHDAIR
jgi:hypothetical protein